MAIATPPHDPLRGTARLASFALAVSLFAVACGGAAADDPGGGGGGSDAAYQTVIQQTQAAFGTSMLAGSVEGDTLKITVVDGAGDGMARLFLCSNVEGFLKAAGLEGSKVVIVTQSGTQLATDADCQP
jgi:hypothetical protein